MSGLERFDGEFGQKRELDRRERDRERELERREQKRIDDEYGDFNATRTRRARVIAWVTIVALLLVGGGSTLLTLLFG